MADDSLGDIKISTYRRKRANGDVYVYQKQTRYDPQKQWNVTIKTRLIGKIPQGEEKMVKTRPKRKAHSDGQNQSRAVHEQASGRRVGMTDLIEYVGSRFRIAEDVIAAYGEADGSKLLSIAWYLLASDGGALPKIETWCINHPTPYRDGITADIYCRLFHDIGTDEDALQRLFMARASLIDTGGTIAFDSSTCSYCGKDIIDARCGYNRHGDGLPAGKLLVLYSVNGRQPVAFAEQPGNIPDVMSLSNALSQFKALNLSRCTICMDEGFYSHQNIAQLFEQHVRFLVRANINSAMIKDILNQHQEQLHRAENVCRSDADIMCCKVKSTFEYETVLRRSDKRTGANKGDVRKHERTVWLGIFRSKLRAANRDAMLHANLEDLRCRIERKEQLSPQGEQDRDRFLIVTKGHGSVKTRINSQAFEESVNRAGVFAVMSNTDGDPEDWLSICRLRENIEDVFSDLRSPVSLTSPEQWTPESFKGRIIAAFITLCYRLGFLAILKEARDKLTRDIDELALKKQSCKNETALRSWITNQSLSQILMWFDCEETAVKTPAGIRRWETEKTKRDQLFLDYTGYTDWAASRQQGSSTP